MRFGMCEHSNFPPCICGPLLEKKILSLESNNYYTWTREKSGQELQAHTSACDGGDGRQYFPHMLIGTKYF
jgi:hypothetical protein